MNETTVLHQLTETSPFMMGFVIVTKNDNVIVVDGGRKEDMPLLKQYIGGRHISAWILTHAHSDHISGFVSEFLENGGADFDLERVYYNFPPVTLLDDPSIPYYESVTREIGETLLNFLKLEPTLGEKAHITQQGESLQIDEVNIEFLFSYHDGLYSNLMNDSSLVFKLTTPNTNVLFLGDLGPEGGDWLYRESKEKLKSDYVQMAHHGHMCCGLEVYAAIMPKACLWCCPDWLYNEGEREGWLGEMWWAKKTGKHRMYGTMLTRQWMDILGVKTHYVTKDGTNTILL